MKIEKKLNFGGKELTLSTGDIAGQATSAVLARYGETVVLATVVSAPLQNDPGYFPLSVEYRERLYAGGKIKGSRWVKREGKPSDDEILTARLIDRSIRPLFPKGYKMDVQVAVMVLSVDLENSPDMVSAVAVSAALTASSIPWNGPVATVRIGQKDDEFLVNPLIKELETSDLDLILSTTKDAIVMIEAGAKEIPENKMVDAIGFGQKESIKLIKFISDFAKEVGIKKEKLVKGKKDPSLSKKVKDLVGGELKDLLKKLATVEMSHTDFAEYKNALADKFEEDERDEVLEIFEDLLKKEMRIMILKGKRADGRKPDEIRKLSAKVGILPRTHGSALFQRGQTQVLSVATLGSSSFDQIIETAEGEEIKKYMHHYSFPPYSVGETGRFGSPSRREIGHGALAERALEPVLPSNEVFPYAIRVVSEVLSSNGSTSMASTCGSTLSLMDAGVPILRPVAGIAMGVVVEDEKNFVVLTDIAGVEDGNGDMDFKVAGTEDGITALQLDVKTLNLTLPIFKKAFEQAKKARIQILDVMAKAIKNPRGSLSVYAPKIKVIKIPRDKIGEVIGPGGKTIKSIIAETGAQVDIEDDGSVTVSAIAKDDVDKAVEKVELLVKEVQAGEIYEGVVKRIESFGAFVEVLPGKDGMVHVSDMSTDFVKDPHNILKIGDRVKVRVKEIDNLGRINLSMLLEGDKKERSERRTPRNEGGRNKPRFNRDNKRKGSQRSSGPHFPASRYLEPKKKKY